MFHSFRFVGLAFLVPGVVSPDLPAAFAEGATYGDIVAVALALLTPAISPWTRRTTRIASLILAFLAKPSVRPIGRYSTSLLTLQPPSQNRSRP
jgi:hypothetical protein